MRTARPSLLFTLALSAEEVLLIRQSRRVVQRNFPPSTQLSQPASTSSLDWKRRTRIPRNNTASANRIDGFGSMGFSYPLTQTLGLFTIREG